MLPAQKLYVETVRRVKRICRAIARELNISVVN
jgi:carbamoyl-phosphate synthase large subunit